MRLVKTIIDKKQKKLNGNKKGVLLTPLIYTIVYIIHQ